MKADLEKFVDDSLAATLAAGYPATRFRQMRKELGTLETIKKLVISGDVQSGFVELKRLGLLQWSLEEAVLRYKPLFSREHVDAAGFRLNMIKGHPYRRPRR
jgi:hypothetical protein